MDDAKVISFLIISTIIIMGGLFVYIFGWQQNPTNKNGIVYKAIQNCKSECQNKGFNESWWEDKWFVQDLCHCGSAGHVSQEAVKRYILEQQGKDVFEYSIFGDNRSQTKIGDFTGGEQ